MLKRFWDWVEKDDPKVTFYLILVPALLLTAIGLIMVLSSSTVESIGAGGGALGDFQRQAISAAIGLVGMIVASKLPHKKLHVLAWLALGIVIVLLFLVAFTPLGVEINGNRNWIRLGPLSLQPAELAKVAFALWTGSIVARKHHFFEKDIKHVLIPILPAGLLILFFVMYGSDLGTAIVIGLMLMTALLLAGLPKRWIVLGALGAGLAAAVMTVTSSNRMLRIEAWLRLNCDHDSHPCYQVDQGLNALAAGGWTGLGLGQSRVKWHYLPEAKSDFVFTILGEELGMLGALFTLGLFVVLLVGIYRTAVNANTHFARVTLGIILMWFAGQIFINIATVTGLLPVIGVPLPFISYGGSALMAILGAIGLALNFTRQQYREQQSLLLELEEKETQHP